MTIRVWKLSSAMELLSGDTFTPLPGWSLAADAPAQASAMPAAIVAVRSQWLAAAVGSRLWFRAWFILGFLRCVMKGEWADSVAGRFSGRRRGSGPIRAAVKAFSWCCRDGQIGRASCRERV